MAEKHPSSVLIKRYGGSRLYNTTAASYLTLNDLAHMVREGRRLRVLDASTGEDITAEILTQSALKLHSIRPEATDESRAGGDNGQPRPMLNGVAGVVTELSLKHCTLARHFDYTGGGRKFPETRASHIPQCCRGA